MQDVITTRPAMEFDDSSRTLSAGSGSVLSESTIVPDEDDLSDSQIDALLQRASLRMKMKNGSLATMNDLAVKLPQLSGTKDLPKPYTSIENGVAKMDERKNVNEQQNKLADQAKKIEEPVAMRNKSKKEPKPTLSDWYNLPRTDLTPALKRDLQLLNMRSVLDPKRMYRKQGKFKVHEYSQMGTVIEGPTEFYSGRIENKNRKQTFVEEVLAGEKESGRFKGKYEDIQGVKKSGKKGFYQGAQLKRRKAIKGG